MVVKKEAFYLAQQVKIMKNALNIENGAVLGLYGGFTIHNSLLVKTFKKYLSDEGIDLILHTEKVDALKGAFNLASELGGK